MDYKGKRCVIEVWDWSGAEVKASFDTSEVTAEFQSVLVKQLTRKGLSPSSETAGSPITVRGRFVRIDEGDRFLRYLLTFLAGKAVLEVEGELIAGGRRLANLHATAKQSGGLFGGNSKGLLKLCAKACAQKVAKQVVSSLKNS